MNLQQLKNHVKSYCFVWVGQNATTGTPNRITSNMSLYGDFIAFKDKQSRDQYYDNFRSNGYDYCVKCTANTGRKFKLGLSVHDYWYHLAYVVDCNRP